MLTRSEASKCGECEGPVSIPPNAIEGEVVTCRDCGTSYELVAQGQGFRISPAEVEGEDWGE